MYVKFSKLKQTRKYKETDLKTYKLILLTLETMMKNKEDHRQDTAFKMSWHSLYG